MATIGAIRTALKNVVDDITTLNAFEQRPGQVTGDAAVVTRKAGPRFVTMSDDEVEYDFGVMILTSLADSSSGQTALDTYVSPTGASSVVAKINANPSLGGVVQWAKVTSVGEDQIVEWAAGSFLGAEIVVSVGTS